MSTTVNASSIPKISWAQNRRQIHISLLIKNNNYGSPSVVFKNDNTTLNIQCQGCLPHEDAANSLQNFDVTLELFAPVVPIEGTDQIKVTDKYIRIILFKKARKSWEKLINVSSQRILEKDEDSFYGKHHKTAIIYDWDLDAVIERQMNVALEEAGMLGEDFSTSDDDNDNNDSDIPSGNNDTGFDGGESGAGGGRVNSLLKNRKKNLKKTGKTSRTSKDPVYGDMPSSSSSSEDDDELLNGNGGVDDNSNNNKDENKNDDKMFGPKRASREQQQQTAMSAAQKKAQQISAKQIVELNRVLPAGQRRSLTDRQILVLVIVIGTICALIGGLLSGSVVYWNMSSMTVSPEVLEKVLKQQQRSQKQQQPVAENNKVESKTMSKEQ